MLFVVDFDMQFTYILIKFENSAHDTKVFNHALNFFTSNLDFFKGKYYFVDAGYFNQKYFLIPYKSVQYYLKEFEVSNLKLSNAKEFFNLKYFFFCNIVECIIGVFK